jgi:hypothetical protein
LRLLESDATVTVTGGEVVDLAKRSTLGWFSRQCVISDGGVSGSGSAGVMVKSSSIVQSVPEGIRA